MESAASDEHAAVLALLPDLEEVRRLHGGARLGVRNHLHADHQPLAAHVAHYVGERVAHFCQPLQQVRAHRQAVRLRFLFLNDLNREEHTNKKSGDSFLQSSSANYIIVYI